MNRVVHSFLFDGNWNLAGLTLRDLTDNSISKVVSPVYTGVVHEEFVREEVDERHETTRLVGFRTSKECADSKLTKSIQPIYYSLDEDICVRALQTLRPGHYQEIPEYGAECHERSFDKLADMTMDSKVEIAEALVRKEKGEREP